MCPNIRVGYMLMDVRAEFIKFFENKNHKVVESSPLVPDDASLLFTNAGMVPFKSIFIGDIPIPNPPRVTSSQTCLRAGGKHNDLENVGYTNRHHTLFEMLGNFSFGDYFKKEAIAYAWEFVTEVLEFDVDRLWVTIHSSDDEAYEIWQEHISAKRIKRFGDEDNFWQMGDSGPCGPCSEIFYDQGADKFSSSEDRLGGDGDRFLEIWNLVFMQYERDRSGKLTPLPKPSIDTGMGLERVVAIKEGVDSNYDSSLFMPLINHISNLTKKEYIYDSGASFRVIADHIRSVTFLLAQGVTFDKEGRGYVLRRILRRAVRHGYLLGLKEPFMYRLVDTLNDTLKGSYPYLQERSKSIKELIYLEEDRFFKTISSGVELFESELKSTKDIFSGEVAFKLYDTYGFPLDLTEDMLKASGLVVDIKEFDRLMGEQKSRAKASWKGSGDEIKEGDFRSLLEEFGENSFIGYEYTKTKSKVLALLNSEYKRVKKLLCGECGWVMFDKTPFYAQGGGQCGDIGWLDSSLVVDTRRFFNLNLSQVEVKSDIKVGDFMEARVSEDRVEISKHHSATHLLHAKLKEVLGSSVNQAGSLVQKDRLRFDFSYPRAMSEQEINMVEDSVNSTILLGETVDSSIMDIEEAKSSGAIALFGEKYGKEVRVVKMGDSSFELCGGTHVKDISSIGLFCITKESGVSAGVRRIEAVCGSAAHRLFKSNRALINFAQEGLKSRDILAGIDKLQSEISTMKKELKTLASSSKSEFSFDDIKGIKVAISKIDSGDIKELIDEAKNRYESVALMLFQVEGSKVSIASGSKNSPVKAGEWIKRVAPLLKGGGGGRDDFAQAGGKDAAKLDQAIKEAREYIKEVIV
jgi:alanyl-tRNA synthetase